MTASWDDKLARALSRGYAGMRVSGNTAWLQDQDWQEFCEYEAQINGACPAQRMIILCTYPAAVLATGEPVDVLRTHQFAVARRRLTWEIVETPQLRQARAEVERLTRELERRAAVHAAQLEAVVDELRKSEARFRLLP